MKFNILLKLVTSRSINGETNNVDKYVQKYWFNKDLYTRIQVDHLLLCKQQLKTISVEYFSINTLKDSTVVIINLLRLRKYTMLSLYLSNPSSSRSRRTTVWFQGIKLQLLLWGGNTSFKYSWISCSSTVFWNLFLWVVVEWTVKDLKIQTFISVKQTLSYTFIMSLTLLFLLYFHKLDLLQCYIDIIYKYRV